MHSTYILEYDNVFFSFSLFAWTWSKNSEDPDQLNLDEAIWSGSALFAKQPQNSLLIEIMLLNWLYNRNECALLMY